MKMQRDKEKTSLESLIGIDEQGTLCILFTGRKIISRSIGLGSLIIKEAKSKMEIGIDLDDVVFDFMGEWRKRLKAKTGIPYSREDIKSYELSDLNGVTTDLMLSIFKEMAESGAMRTLDLIPGSVETIKELMRDGHQLWYITGRRDNLDLQIDTRFSLEWHGIFNPVFYTQNKGKTAKDLNLGLMIEDAPKYIEQLNRMGVPTLVFNQPWNQEVKNRRVKAWTEIKDIVTDLTHRRGYYESRI